MPYVVSDDEMDGFLAAVAEHCAALEKYNMPVVTALQSVLASTATIEAKHSEVVESIPQISAACRSQKVVVPACVTSPKLGGVTRWCVDKFFFIFPFFAVFAR
eukprot:PhM_4_TR5236/c4_g1_i1/m.769